MSSSAIGSSLPVTTTGCGTFQFVAVNVSDVTDTVPSVVSDDVTPIVTSEVVSDWSTTVNASKSRSSEVTRPDVGVTRIPAVSSSALMPGTSFGLNPLYIVSALVAAASTIVNGWSSSSMSSLTPVTTTGCGVFQLFGVNNSWAVETVASV